MINGVINIYKEKGYTSHDVVAKLRGILGQKKIGHTGTLDPDAEGVLPVCLGKGTKLCDMLTDRDKTYIAVMKLGVVTDTQDMTGTILEEKPVTVGAEEIRAAVMGFVGEYQQIPPMYSALKVGGRKLYELAREGTVIERQARTVWIREINILEIGTDEVKMEVTCSKGTYIRTLCQDIGESLGCGGCMKSLLRSKVGRFVLDESIRLDEVICLRDAGELASHISSIESMFPEYGSITVKEEGTRFLYNGNILSEDLIEAKDISDTSLPVRVYDKEGQFVGVFEYKESDQVYKPLKMFI